MMVLVVVNILYFAFDRCCFVLDLAKLNHVEFGKIFDFIFVRTNTKIIFLQGLKLKRMTFIEIICMFKP